MFLQLWEQQMFTRLLRKQEDLFDGTRDQTEDIAVAKAMQKPGKSHAKRRKTRAEIRSPGYKKRPCGQKENDSVVSESYAKESAPNEQRLRRIVQEKPARPAFWRIFRVTHEQIKQNHTCNQICKKYY